VIATGLLTENEYLMNERWGFAIELKFQISAQSRSRPGLAPGRSRSDRVSAVRQLCGARDW
jgi:hypothetical protein